MNIWLIAATASLLCIAVCFVVALRKDPLVSLVAAEAATVMAVMILLLLAEAYRRPVFTDLALALALLSFGGGLTFARFLERWL